MARTLTDDAVDVFLLCHKWEGDGDSGSARDLLGEFPYLGPPPQGEVERRCHTELGRQGAK